MRESNMKIAGIALCAALLSGCATCNKHPVVCGVAAGIIVTGIAFSVSGPGHHPSAPPPSANTQPVNCQSNPGMCQ